MPNDLILIAEDESAILTQLSDTFIANGYRTICASNGLQAWDALFTHDPDDFAACVTDLQMPPGSLGGKDLVAKIRKGFSKLIPIVIYSGRGTISTSHEVTRAGADAFVEKEAGAQQLVNTVAKLIAENIKPISQKPSSMSELARNSDLPALALRSIRNLERIIRVTILEKCTPSNLLAAFLQRKQTLAPHVVEKLSKTTDFAHDKSLSLGDLLDLIAAMSASQLQPLPSASELRRFAGDIVPVRNKLFHGRPITDREILVAILSTDDLIDKIRNIG